MSLLSYAEHTFYFFFVWLRWSAFGTCFVLIVVPLDRCGLLLFYFPVSRENLPIFSLFLPTLRDFPWEKVRERGERLQRTAAMLDLRQAAHGTPAWEAG